MFRTRKDFSFPYPLSGNDQQRAKDYGRNVWMANAWPGQVRPLRWLVDKFWPVPGWTEEQREALPASLPARSSKAGPTKAILYYSDCRGDQTLLGAVRQNLERVKNGHEVVSVTLQPVDFGRNIHLPLERGVLTMAKQILAGLEAMTADVVFFCEHDLWYSADHLAFTPPSMDRYFYNENTFKLDVKTGQCVFYYTKQLSGLCASRTLLLEHFRKRVASIEANGFSRRNGFEPGTRSTKDGGFDDVPAERWMSQTPNVDLRTGYNLTESRWTPAAFRSQRNCQGWKEVTEIPGVGPVKTFLEGITHGH